MKLSVAWLAVTLLATNVELKYSKRRKNTVAEAFYDAEIVPDVIPVAPKGLLEVCYEDVVINLGNSIWPGDAIGLPTLNFDVEKGCYYTVIIFDKDVPCASKPTWRSYLMALWVNVVDLDLAEAGCAIGACVGPSPIPGTESHTYTILLYKQPDKIDISDDNIKCLATDRLKFNVEQFAANYGLCDPVAGNFYCSEFPKSKKMN